MNLSTLVNYVKDIFLLFFSQHSAFLELNERSTMMTIWDGTVYETRIRYSTVTKYMHKMFDAFVLPHLNC